MTIKLCPCGQSFVFLADDEEQAHAEALDMLEHVVACIVLEASSIAATAATL